MERAEFERRLVLAARRAIEYAAPMVRQELPSVQQFLIRPHASYDGNPLEADEEVFPHDSLPADKTHGPLGASAAVDWLWRRGKVPEWIDVRAFDADATSTTLWLECCGRFTALEQQLYHTKEGIPPFHVTSPLLPSIDWDTVEEHGRFDLEAKRRAG